MRRSFGEPVICSSTSSFSIKLSDWMLKVLIALILPLGMFGCTAQKSFHAYDGSEYSLKEVAVIIIEMSSTRMYSSGAHIKSIDGKEVKGGNILEFHLLPGIHTIEGTYDIGTHVTYDEHIIKNYELGGKWSYIKGPGGVIYKMGLINEKVATESYEEPIFVRADFKQGYVYKLAPKAPYWTVDASYNDGYLLFNDYMTAGYWKTELILLDTVEDVACSPELRPDYAAGSKMEGLLWFGVPGYVLAQPPAAANPWKELAKSHCPDKVK